VRIQERLAQPAHDAGHQGVAHQNRPLGRGDAFDAGVATGKAVEGLELLGHQAAQPPVAVAHYVGGARRAGLAFAGDEGSGRTLQRIRKRQGAFGVGVGMALGAGALQRLGTFERLPARQTGLV